MGELEEKKGMEELSDKSKALPVVVVVDDEEILLEFYREALRDFCNVYTFNNAKDALSFFAENKVSLLIVDRSMPYMSGDDLCSYLRSQPKTQNLPIIVISGKKKEIEEITEMMTNKSIETYITKPILDLKRFISNVQAYINTNKKNDTSDQKEATSDQKEATSSINHEL